MEALVGIIQGLISDVFQGLFVRGLKSVSVALTKYTKTRLKKLGLLRREFKIDNDIIDYCEKLISRVSKLECELLEKVQEITRLKSRKGKPKKKK